MNWDEMTEEERNCAVSLFVMDLKQSGYISPYTTSMNAVWEVVEHFRGRYDVHVGSAPFQYDVAILDREMSGVSYNASAKSAPEAICLAALKAAGKLDERGSLLLTELWQIRYLTKRS